MKDIYDLLNDVDFNTNDYENMNINVDDLTKKRLKKNLRKNIVTKNKHKKKILIASLSALCVTGLLIPKESYVTFAEKTPVISSIFENFRDSGYLGDYKSYGQEVTDKGFSVKINEVILDDNKLNFAYTIKTNKNMNDLCKIGAFPFCPDQIIKINNTRLNVCGGGTYKILDDHTVKCISSLEIVGKKIPSRFTMSVDLKKLNNVKGNWKFAFNVEKSKIEKQIKKFDINKNISFKDGVNKNIKVTLKSFNISPISAALNIKCHTPINVSYCGFIVTDENNTQLQQTGCSVNGLLAEPEMNLMFTSQYKVPKKLKIIPYKILQNDGMLVNSHIKSKSTLSTLPLKINQGKVGSLTVKNVEFKDTKTIINYTTEGIAPLSQADIVLYDEKGKTISPNADNDFNLRKNANNPNEYTEEFPKLDKNKKYYIGTSDFSNIYFDEANKLEVNLK